MSCVQFSLCHLNLLFLGSYLLWLTGTSCTSGSTPSNTLWRTFTSGTAKHRSRPANRGPSRVVAPPPTRALHESSHLALPLLHQRYLTVHACVKSAQNTVCVYVCVCVCVCVCARSNVCVCNLICTHSYLMSHQLPSQWAAYWYLVPRHMPS